MTGVVSATPRRRTVSMVSSMTRASSSAESVGDSPVVPTGTRPLMPASIWRSTRRTSVASSSGTVGVTWA